MRAFALFALLVVGLEGAHDVEDRLDASLQREDEIEGDIEGAPDRESDADIIAAIMGIRMEIRDQVRKGRKVPQGEPLTTAIPLSAASLAAHNELMSEQASGVDDDERSEGGEVAPTVQKVVDDDERSEGGEVAPTVLKAAAAPSLKRAMTLRGGAIRQPDCKAVAVGCLVVVREAAPLKKGQQGKVISHEPGTAFWKVQFDKEIIGFAVNQLVPLEVVNEVKASLTREQVETASDTALQRLVKLKGFAARLKGKGSLNDAELRAAVAEMKKGPTGPAKMKAEGQQAVDEIMEVAKNVCICQGSTYRKTNTDLKNCGNGDKFPCSGCKHKNAMYTCVDGKYL